jgi:hypothetical protein
MTCNEVLDRYRQLRAISTQHHSAALKFLARSTILEHARRLGLAKGKALLVQNEAELTLVSTSPSIPPGKAARGPSIAMPRRRSPLRAPMRR